MRPNRTDSIDDFTSIVSVLFGFINLIKEKQFRRNDLHHPLFTAGQTFL